MTEARSGGDPLPGGGWPPAWWAVAPPASGNRAVSFSGGSLLPYIEPVSSPGADPVVISKDGQMTADFAHHAGRGREMTGGGGAWEDEGQGSPMGLVPAQLYKM